MFKIIESTGAKNVMSEMYFTANFHNVMKLEAMASIVVDIVGSMTSVFSASMADFNRQSWKYAQ